MKRFASCHPAAAFLFFAAVIGTTMFCLHPVLTPLSLLLALGTAAVLCPRHTASQCVALALALPPLSAALNALFSHAGVTILLYLPSGNPLTRESLVYGAFAGGMLAAVLVWFAVVRAVMTSDKLLWLFSRLAPALALLLSMTLRFVPRSPCPWTPFSPSALYTVAEFFRRFRILSCKCDGYVKFFTNLCNFFNKLLTTAIYLAIMKP